VLLQLPPDLRGVPHLLAECLGQFPAAPRDAAAFATAVASRGREATRAWPDRDTQDRSVERF
jgi:hypothetical protein